MSKCNHNGFVYWNGDDFYCQRCSEILPEAPSYFTEQDIKELKGIE